MNCLGKSLFIIKLSATSNCNLLTPSQRSITNTNHILWRIPDSGSSLTNTGTTDNRPKPALQSLVSRACLADCTRSAGLGRVQLVWFTCESATNTLAHLCSLPARSGCERADTGRTGRKAAGCGRPTCRRRTKYRMRSVGRRWVHLLALGTCASVWMSESTLCTLVHILLYI